MTRIPDEDRQILEQAIFLPMLLTIFNRDISIIESSPFKLRDPYIHLIEGAMKRVHKDLYLAKQQLKERKLKVYQIKRDDAFTLFSFIYKGYEEQHNYFNPRIRNEVTVLMEKYLIKHE